MTRNKISLISEPAVTIYLIPPINRRAICYLFKDYFNFTMIVTLMSQNPNKEIVNHSGNKCVVIFFEYFSALHSKNIMDILQIAVSLLSV